MTEWNKTAGNGTTQSKKQSGKIIFRATGIPKEKMKAPTHHNTSANIPMERRMSVGTDNHLAQPPTTRATIRSAEPARALRTTVRPVSRQSIRTREAETGRMSSICVYDSLPHASANVDASMCQPETRETAHKKQNSLYGRNLVIRGLSGFCAQS